MSSHSLKNLMKNFNSLYNNFYNYMLYGLYYGFVPTIVVYGKPITDSNKHRCILC
jgi:hypothetical protein